MTDDRLADELRRSFGAEVQDVANHPKHFCLLRGGELKSGAGSEPDATPEWCSDENCACHDEEPMP